MRGDAAHCADGVNRRCVWHAAAFRHLSRAAAFPELDRSLVRARGTALHCSLARVVARSAARGERCALPYGRTVKLALAGRTPGLPAHGIDRLFASGSGVLTSHLPAASIGRTIFDRAAGHTQTCITVPPDRNSRPVRPALCSYIQIYSDSLS